MSVRNEARDRRISVMAAAAARAHATMLRRNLTSIRQVGRPSVRSREVAWVVIEALDAAFEGRPLTHKELSATSHGVIGAATVTRAVDRAVQRGLLRRLRHAGDARLTLLVPTEAAHAFLTGRAEAAYAEIRDVVLAAERALGALPP
ncbi:hypothetical protein ACE7GA_08210 [Roseomonas sp. CCTCC AB2023176]|uniref:hypothetical protein n=1 Tax=Roseomonas sp. CCTCC AB2023176 TaxID=3342640 RepID=UPI0035DDD074